MTHSIFDDSAFEFQSAFVEAILNGNKTAHLRKLYKKIYVVVKETFANSSSIAQVFFDDSSFSHLQVKTR